MRRKIVLPGGSGFLGAALARRFSTADWDVVILSRRATPPRGAIRTVIWDGSTPGPWSAELEAAEAVINLSGRNIACVFTPQNRRDILASRLASVRAVEDAAAACRQPPAVLIQASAIGLYGHTGERICDETAPPGGDFLAEVVLAWERAFFTGNAGGPRRVALRCGHILGREGGFLPPLARLARLGLGGAIGRGRQYLSWLHVADFCSLCAWAVAEPTCRGAYNGVSPEPVTNAEFMRELRGALGRPWCPPAPAWIVKLIACPVLQVDPSLVLAGCRAQPRRLLDAGFDFRFPHLAGALRDLTGRA